MEQTKIDKIGKFIKEALYLTFASTDYRCLSCDAELSSRDEYLCKNCKQDLSVDNTPKCIVCSKLVNEEGMCSYCKKGIKTYKKVYTVFEYTKPIDTFINQFKEQGKTIYGKMFVKSLIEKYDDFQIEDIDLITSVPANKYRKIARLRDAPRYFAKALSKHTGIEYSHNCLKRKGIAKAMRKKSPEQRIKIAGKSYASGSCNVIDKNILLVDDVFTTGATAHVCTNLLLVNGAKSVTILAMVGVRGK